MTNNWTDESKERIRQSRLGKKWSDEVKQKISDSRKGKCVGSENPFYGKHHTPEALKANSDKHIGKPAWNKGKNLSLEHRKHLSDSHKGRTFSHSPETCAKISKWRNEHKELISGPNASNWQGGKMYEPYCPKFNEEFKEYIRNKFSRICFICGIPEEEHIQNAIRKQRLHIHHVDYDKNDICNGYSWPFIPLCASCHAKTNYTRWYWFNKYMNYWIYNYIDFTNTLTLI